ncbi:MAG: STAS domain-containing protein [Pseudomonadota bacterium]
MSEPIVLPARLDPDAVATLATDMRGAALCDTVQIDASAVMHLGALGAQLLLSTAKTAKTLGGRVSIVAISDRARDQLAAMGLTPGEVEEGGA